MRKFFSETVCLVVIIAGALALLPEGHAIDEFPGPENFMRMPFDTISIGLQPEMTSIPEILPEMNAGEMMFLFLDRQGEAHIVFPETEYLLTLFQPQERLPVKKTSITESLCSDSSEAFITSIGSGGNYPVYREAAFVFAFGTCTNMMVGKGQQALHEIDKKAGSMTTLKAEQQEFMLAGSGALVSYADSFSQKRERAISNIKSKTFTRKEQAVSETGAIATGLASTETIMAEETGGNQTITKEAKVENIDEAGAEFTVMHDLQVSEETVEAGDQTVEDGLMIGAHALSGSNETVSDKDQLKGVAIHDGALQTFVVNKTGIQKMLHDGMLPSVYDESLHESLYGAMIAMAEYDIANFSGIFDDALHQIICDAQFIPTVTEMSDFQMLLDSDIVVSDLLHRPFSEGFRLNAPEGGDNCQIESEFNAFPDILYHGHLAVVSISIKNTGDAPIYDMVAVAAIPEHTAFAGFHENNPAKSGYLNFYVKARNIVVMKIYRPLNPSETFQNLIILKIDSWRV